MHIIVLGSGQVSYSVVNYLISESYDVTVIDNNELAIKQLQINFDIRGIVGNPCDPVCLREAGLENADALISVTINDEVNMIACLIAYKLFSTSLRIACIRNRNYFLYPDALDIAKIFSINTLFNPEEEVVDYIYELVINFGVIEKLPFFNNYFSMILVKILPHMSICSQKISSLDSIVSDVYFVFGGIYTSSGFTKNPELYLSPNDQAYFFLKKDDVGVFLDSINQKYANKQKNITIVGGGDIGMGLAVRLQKDFNIKLIEKNPKQAEKIAKYLDETMVLIGDATDAELLVEENIQNADIFIAVTDSDEVNLLSSQLAKRNNVGEVVSILNRKDYIQLAEQSKDIDIIILPDHTTLNTVLFAMRQTNIMVRYALYHNKIQALEFLITLDSKWTYQRVKDISLPEDIYVAAVMRGSNLFQASANFRIKVDDHLLIILSNHYSNKRLQKIFG